MGKNKVKSFIGAGTGTGTDAENKYRTDGWMDDGQGTWPVNLDWLLMD